MKKRKKAKKKKRLILTCICLALSFLIITSFIKQDNNKIENVKKEKNISAFIEDKDYKNKNEKYDYQTVVTYVNIDLDIPDYENMNIIENPEDFWVIVNKHNKLPDNYKPKNLVVMNPNNELRTTIKEIAMEPLKEFFNAAKKEGHNLYQTNTYRSYSWQNDLYTAYKKKDGIEKLILIQLGQETLNIKPDLQLMSQTLMFKVKDLTKMMKYGLKKIVINMVLF